MDKRDDQYFTRLGDGSGVFMSRSQLREEVEAGMADAVDKGKAEPLTPSDLDALVDILTMKEKNVSVERGNEGICTFDAGTLKMTVRAGLPVDRISACQVHERALCSDSIELCNTDYSYKALKNIVQEEAMAMERAQLSCIIPILYGAMPNLGLYTKPDGPYENWSQLLPEGRIQEALEAQEQAAAQCARDMVFIGSVMAEAGADGLQFDTVGASGDADALAAFEAASILSAKYPDLCITMGMANEFHLGMHGRLKFKGERLAGQYPARQVKTTEAAGAGSFGVVVNTNSSRSLAWNLARSVTYTKDAVRVAGIPVLANAGMGVGGIPLTNTSPTDATTRVAKALLEIGKADGL